MLIATLTGPDAPDIVEAATESIRIAGGASLVGVERVVRDDRLTLRLTLEIPHPEVGDGEVPACLELVRLAIRMRMKVTFETPSD